MRAFLALVVAGAVLVLAAGADQSAPNATRAVMGARQSFCTNEQRLVSTPHSGWLPTANCQFPPAVPVVAP